MCIVIAIELDVLLNSVHVYMIKSGEVCESFSIAFRFIAGNFCLL